MKNIYKRTTNSHLQIIKKKLKKYPKTRKVLKTIVPTQLYTKKDLYTQWLKSNSINDRQLQSLVSKSKAFNYRPLISVIIPTYNTNHKFLRSCLDSVIGQAYTNWEACIVDDASSDSAVRAIIQEYSTRDERIKYKFLNENQHIAGATNEAVKISTGEFVSLFDHDDILWPNALYEVVRALNYDRKLDLIYSDEDKISGKSDKHSSPFFKPDWNPDFLHSVNYITHFSTIRKSLVNKVGGFSKKHNGAQDWDLFLRVTHESKRIYHIPKILYSWRIHQGSTALNTEEKSYVIEAQRKTLQDDLLRKGYETMVIERDVSNKDYWRVEYPVINNPLISIVIPTKNQYKVIKRCIESIYEKTSYKNFEIILVDTGSDDKRVLSWYKKIKQQNSNIRIVNWAEKPFSYARSCNKGASIARGKLLLMLNNDTEVFTPRWLDIMAGDALRPEIGAVGCKLFFPDKKHIQHAGVGVGLGGLAANSFSMTVDSHLTPTQHLYLNTKHNMTAVTAACLMIRKDLYEKIGGFDEEFRVTYNDVDLCLRLVEAGYNNLYIPFVELLHHESISVGLPEEKNKRDTIEMQEAVALFKKRWQKYIDNDPNFNPNLDKGKAAYEVDPNAKST